MKDNALEVAALAGHIMLENGAEISRVEEVMQRIASAYGQSSSNFFVLSNGIFTTGSGYANVEYIPFHGTQLDKVVEVNQLSRDVAAGRYTLEETEKRLKEIRNLAPHPVWEQVLASALGSAGFCMIFGGSLIDCLVSLVCGIILWFFVLYVSAPLLSKITANILGGALVTAICILCWHSGICHLGNIIIGAIIPLIPGVSFTNGIRDIAAEDYIAGATRLLDALMGFLCIALGVSLAFLIDSHIEGSMILLDGMKTDMQTAGWLWQILAALVGTAAFSVIFGVPRRYYMDCGICGALGWIVYLAMMRLCGTGSVEATLFATMAVVISAYVFAYSKGCPVIVFLICGIFPLVPGAGIFWTSYNIVSDQLTAALTSGFLAVKLAFAIVFGIIIITEIRKRAATLLKTLTLLLLPLFAPTEARADAIDSLQHLLTQDVQIQEKVYLHTDNNSYYVGDTIWYKAYVLNADNLKPEALSKILYVELLTPDGYLVERQRVIIDHNTQSHGQFYLPDSIYSGFYELRAYTRWQLNFNSRQREHSENDDRWFYNRQLANDYFTEYEGLFSRVLPIYERPLEPGDYADKRIIDRPRRRQNKEQQGMTMTFYPEGGSIIAGLTNHIAFEALDPYGKPIAIEGTLSDGSTFKSIADGRGIITFSPSSSHGVQASVTYQGKTYSFDLPAIQPTGATITYDAQTGKAQIFSQGATIAAVTVSCRGRLVQFLREAVQTIDAALLPTGVNEIVAYDAEARPLAVRQIFVNHHDNSQRLDFHLQTGDESSDQQSISAAPYQQVSLQSRLKEQGLVTVSVSVRDLRGELPSYNDGNIMTDLLLAGDLRGFVAHPSYYFEADDQQHRQRLDLLMMVQGWRKYAPVPRLRYKHERTFQMEGQIYKLNTNDINEFDLLQYTHSMNGGSNPTFTYDNFGKISLAMEHSEHAVTAMSYSTSDNDKNEGQTEESAAPELPEFTDELIQNERRNHKVNTFKERILVEAELVKDKDVAGVVVAVDSTGRFAFDLPPFYDQAIMFMTAYAAKDSATMCLSSKKDKDKNNPFACPDFYVRREIFFPKYTQPYSWFQTHTPEEDNEFDMDIDNIKDSLGLEHHLNNVEVKTKRRRVLHAFDRSKPAMTRDFGQIYNEAIDYGLHYTGYNSLSFYEAASRVMFGNMNNAHRPIGIKATTDQHIFLRTYMYSSNELTGRPITDAVLNKKIDPRHIWKLRIFTDFDMRNGVGKEENRSQPDVWYELVETPGSRIIRRDRRFVFDGFAYPDEFYHCDYSNVIPTEPTDYRRTYYWNANAHADQDGNLNIQFYNGSRPSLLQVSICGITADGKIFY